MNTCIIYGYGQTWGRCLYVSIIADIHIMKSYAVVRKANVEAQIQLGGMFDN